MSKRLTALDFVSLVVGVLVICVGVAGLVQNFVETQDRLAQLQSDLGDWKYVAEIFAEGILLSQREIDALDWTGGFSSPRPLNSPTPWVHHGSTWRGEDGSSYMRYLVYVPGHDEDIVVWVKRNAVWVEGD